MKKTEKKRRTKKILFKNNFQNEATLVMENEKANTWQACYSRHQRCARVLFPFHLWEVLENEKWKNGKNAHQQKTFQEWFSERGHSRNKTYKSEHVASLSQPPPLMCACLFSILCVRSARKWKKKKRGKRRTNKKLFKNDFQNEATLVMEIIKANTWQACLSRHHWSARVLFPFCRWEVLENEKRKNGENAHQFFFCQKRFSERGHSRNEKWKSKHVASLLQPSPLMCACSFSISSVRSARKWKKVCFSKAPPPSPQA